MAFFHVTGTVRDTHHESNVWTGSGHASRYVEVGERVTLLVEAPDEAEARWAAVYKRRLGELGAITEYRLERNR
jgi:hypothetical protein